MKTISQVLQDATARAIKEGETVHGIAVAAGITSPSLHRFVTGERGLNLESADKLARYFRLELQPVPTKARKQK